MAVQTSCCTSYFSGVIPTKSQKWSRAWFICLTLNRLHLEQVHAVGNRSFIIRNSLLKPEREFHTRTKCLTCLQSNNIQQNPHLNLPTYKSCSKKSNQKEISRVPLENIMLDMPSVLKCMHTVTSFIKQDVQKILKPHALLVPRRLGRKYPILIHFVPHKSVLHS